MLQILRRKLAPVYENMFSFWPGGWSPFPSNVVFELLYACNLACPFCYLRVEEKVKKIKAQRHLLTGEILRTIDQIPSQTGISFTGGVPIPLLPSGNPTSVYFTFPIRPLKTSSAA